MNWKSEEYFEYSKNKRGCNFEAKGEWQQKYVQMVNNTFNLVNKTLLDVGCAMGALTSTFKDIGINAEGCDISEYMIKKTPFNNVNLYPYSILELHKLDKEYDFILCSEVVGHVNPKDSNKIAEQFAEVSKNDTIVYLQYEESYKKDKKAYGKLSEDDDITHVNRRSKSYWIEQFIKAGFQVEKKYDSQLKSQEMYKEYNWDFIVFRKVV